MAHATQGGRSQGPLTSRRPWPASFRRFISGMPATQGASREEQGVGRPERIGVNRRPASPNGHGTNGTSSTTRLTAIQMPPAVDQHAQGPSRQGLLCCPGAARQAPKIVGQRNDNK
eukprot:38698-Chlamydomonas_euryale.AAC.1